MEDWESNIRADMWTTMTASQLCKQQDLVIDKIVKLNMLPSTDPSVRDLLGALHIAKDDLTYLIDVGMSNQPNRIPM